MENPIPSIRPRQIFKLVEDKFPDQNVEITLTMPPSAIGSLLTLESSLLVALLKITEAKNIFEIGTYNGNTALLIANNTPADAVVNTLDLPPDDIEMHDPSKLDLADADQNDQFLRQIFKLVEDKFPDQNVEITLTMPPSAIGSLLTLESSLLVALLKITEAKNIFEIGTYNGNTALLIANNTPADA
ncbi:MAG: hypothetical protein ACK5TH_22750, partial [Prosthecobacter sp.]